MVGGIAGDHESERAPMNEVARLLGIGTAETVRKSVRQVEVDAARVRELGTAANAIPAWVHRDRDDGPMRPEAYALMIDNLLGRVSRPDDIAWRGRLPVQRRRHVVTGHVLDVNGDQAL
jgi:hypothetical protein